MSREQEQEKLWRDVFTFAQEENVEEVRNLLPKLIAETLRTLEMSVQALDEMKVTTANIMAFKNLKRLQHLDDKIKRCMRLKSYSLAYQYFLEYIGWVTENGEQAIASLTAAASEKGNEESCYTLEDVARRMELDTETIERFCEEGRFQGAFRTSWGQWRIPKSSFKMTEAEWDEAEEVARELHRKFRDHAGDDFDEFDLI